PKSATPVAPTEATPAKDQSSAVPARDKPETTASAPANALDGKTAAAIAPTLQPPAAPVVPAPAAVPAPTVATADPVTGIKDIPPTLGTPGQRRAALEGDARAVYELAAKAADATGTARDPKVALRLFERAAAAGLAPAQFRLGNMFEKGIGTGRDIALARLWYERAADKGNAKAMHNLAVLYAEGASGKPDYATAVQWFRQAAEHGVRDSQYNLAILMARGLGTAQDLTQSYTWFAVAAGQGDEDAGKKREEVAGQLQPAELTAAKAAVSRWQAKTPVPGANEVVSPQGGWDESPAQPAKKPAKISRG
ncbi:MAG: tetratricopeptide repeat protein, partial [Bosea sp. (in: a-proteobacteria)]